MDKKDRSIQIMEAFGISSRHFFLVEGSHAAEFAMTLQAILENYPREQLGNEFYRRLFDLQQKFGNLFLMYRQAYLDDPDIPERVDRYIKILELFSALAVEFESALSKLRDLRNKKQIELIEKANITEGTITIWFDASEEVIKKILAKYHKMQFLFR